MKYSLLCFYMLFMNVFTLDAVSADAEVKDSPFIGQLYKLPEYMMVVNNYEEREASQIVKETGRDLVAISHALSMSNYSSEQEVVVELLPKGAELKIEKVYFSGPDFMGKLFEVSGHHFVLASYKGKNYTVSPVMIRDNEIHYMTEVNDCERDDACQRWQKALNNCESGGLCRYGFSLHLRDGEGIWQSRRGHRAPYPKDWHDNSFKKIKAYIKKHNIKSYEDEVTDAHLMLDIETDVLGLVNILLQHENLNVDVESIHTVL